MDVESYLGYSLTQPPAAGRSPGEDWARQRWEECFPKVYCTTAQAGARPKGALSV
jgi:manganese oxidase